MQVCYEINAYNFDREINGLLKLKFECDEKILIIYDGADEFDRQEDIKVVKERLFSLGADGVVYVWDLGVIE